MTQRAAWTDHKGRAWTVEETRKWDLPTVSITCNGVSIEPLRKLPDIGVAVRELVRFHGCRKAANRRARKAALHAQLAREIGRVA